MKSYYLDEISTKDMEQIVSYLNENALESGMERLFWIKIPSEVLTDFQSGHPECKPHRFAIEIGDTWLKAELFVRTSVKFRCDCNGYCNTNQREFIIKYIDNMIKDLAVQT